MFLLLLFAFIVFSGAVTLEILLFAVGIGVLVLLFAVKFMGYSLKKEAKIYIKLPLIIAYLFVLLYEIIKANILTSIFILKGNKKTAPSLVTFDSPLKSEFAGTVLANSITLTPGTISVSFRNGKFRVHCLDDSLSRGIDSSHLVCLLKKIEA